MTDITSPMRREAPPARRGRGQSAVTRGKRIQLVSNPGEWFVWHESAPYYEYGRKTLTQLAGLKANARFSKTDVDFEVRVRRNDDGTYKVYARYNPRGN